MQGAYEIVDYAVARGISIYQTTLFVPKVEKLRWFVSMKQVLMWIFATKP
jgi:hypothetical protein